MVGCLHYLARSSAVALVSLRSSIAIATVSLMVRVHASCLRWAVCRANIIPLVPGDAVVGLAVGSLYCYVAAAAAFDGRNELTEERKCVQSCREVRRRNSCFRIVLDAVVVGAGRRTCSFPIRLLGFPDTMHVVDRVPGCCDCRTSVARAFLHPSDRLPRL